MSAASTRQLRAADVAHMLALRIDQLARELLPGGHREGHEWRAGSLTGEAGSSLGVRLSGTKAGVFCDFATGQTGDPLDLIAGVHGINLGEAIKWGRHWLGIDTGNAELPRRPITQPAKAETADRQARALDIWRSAAESIIGTPAQIYLQSRGLDPARLVSLWGSGQWPATLRYSDQAAFDPASKCLALIVAIHGADCGLVRAIHRILLTPDGTSIRDQRGRRIKLALGPVAGNAARFDCGPDPRGYWGIAEGVESALGAHQLTGIPTWSTISAGNLRNIAPPAWARHITIFADRDGPGESAAAAALRRFRDLPDIESVRIIAPTKKAATPQMWSGGNHDRATPRWDGRHHESRPERQK